MRKRLIILLAAAGLMATALPAVAAPPLRWAQETNRSACEATGAPVINVVQHVTGDIDSGFHGGWAVDTYTRRIKVWEVGNDTYCAVVRYSGTFDAIADANSPGEEGGTPLGGDEHGSMVGGYRAIISTALLANPTYSLRGNLGPFDYKCSDVGVCPGAIDWVKAYFGSGYDFDFEFWGWVYRAGRHGTWVNADSGSSGDIS